MAQISYDDQVFVSAFIKTHGSIKEMERIFGVSYPTIKARLNAIADRLGSWGVDISLTTIEENPLLVHFGSKSC